MKKKISLEQSSLAIRHFRPENTLYVEYRKITQQLYMPVCVSMYNLANSDKLTSLNYKIRNIEFN